MSNEEGADSGQSSPESSPASGGKPQTTSKAGSSKKSKATKERLTPSQKNFNHKDAENKRRTAIRDNFTKLSQLVPGASGHERSEQVMLGKTTDHLRAQIIELRQLEELAAQRGITLDPEESLRDDDFGGPNWRPRNMEQYEASKQKKEVGDPQQGSTRDDEEDD